MQVSHKILEVLKAEHISPEELQYMLMHAAITSLHGCNKRYFNWCFLMSDGVLKKMQHADVVEVGQGETRMLEDHEECGGEGCRQCGWSGQVSRGIADTTAQALSVSR